MLAHEILLREWPALREWLDRNRARLQRVQRIMTSLSAEDAQERQFAIKMLADAAGVSDIVVPALIKSLNDENKGVRAVAVEALGRVGELAVTAVPDLVNIGEDGWDHSMGLSWEELAKGALARIGPAAVPELLKIRGHGVFVAEALAGIGSPAAGALPYLISLLRAGSNSERIAAARAMGDIGALSAEVIGELIESLQDNEEQVRGYLVATLARGGDLVIPTLVALMGQKLLTATRSQPRDSFPVYAAETLTLIGPDAVEAVPCLLTMLQVRNDRFRIAAIRALGRIGAGMSQVIEAIVPHLGNATEDVRAASAAALGQIGRAAIPFLINALKHPQMHIREGAAYALGNMGRSASEAVNALTPLLDDPEPFVQAAAAQALGHIRTPVSHFLSSLLSCVGSDNEHVRGSAMIALGRIGAAAAPAVPALAHALSDEDWTVRGCAAASLSRFGASAAGAVGALLNLLSDPEERVRAAAVAALGAIGPATTEVVPALLSTFFSSPPGSVRSAAQEALNQIKFVSPELLPVYFSNEISYFDMRREYEQSTYPISAHKGT
jgi:HEAT repeat protein